MTPILDHSPEPRYTDLCAGDPGYAEAQAYLELSRELLDINDRFIRGEVCRVEVDLVKAREEAAWEALVKRLSEEPKS